MAQQFDADLLASEYGSGSADDSEIGAGNPFATLNVATANPQGSILDVPGGVIGGVIGGVVRCGRCPAAWPPCTEPSDLNSRLAVA